MNRVKRRRGREATTTWLSIVQEQEGDNKKLPAAGPPVVSYSNSHDTIFGDFTICL